MDSTCIDCDTCRQLAPATFHEDGDYSTVFRQPETAREEFAAYQALIACPVVSIGTEKKDRKIFLDAQASFPLHIEGGVDYVGFNSEKSFGANSYFIQHSQGNWLVDSPRSSSTWFRHLKRKVEFGTSSSVTRMMWRRRLVMQSILMPSGSFIVQTLLPCRVQSK